MLFRSSVARALRNVRVGDQVHVRGYLADYTNFKDPARPGLRDTCATVRRNSCKGLAGQEGARHGTAR